MIKETLRNRLNPTSRKPEIGFVRDFTETDLHDDKKIEDLVKQGRVPSISFFQEAHSYHDDEYAIVEIPPVGVSFGQKAIKTPEGMLKFYVGERLIGVSKGLKTNTISGRHIEGRVNKMLDLIGRAHTSPYEFIEE